MKQFVYVFLFLGITFLQSSFLLSDDGSFEKLYIYRFNANDLRQLRNVNVKKITHGLDDQQIERLKVLTNGKVDFSNIYGVKSMKPLRGKGVSDRLVGVIHKNVPPPVIVKADEKLDKEWWIQKLQVKDAWAYATGKNVVIADCDAGYFTDEPDLKSNLLLDDSYDYADLQAPLVINDGNYTYHGTAVAAIIAGVQDGKGTNGIAFDSKLVPLQNYNYSSALDDLDKEEATAQCILGAIKVPNIKVIVLENQTSNGSSETYIGTREAVKLALEAGITIVSAGGNYSVELIEEEKNDTGSIIVGALSIDDQMAYFSNYGSRITVAAYGEQLNTLCYQGGGFCAFGGTSGATPQVAATVALMLEANPNLTPADVKSILISTRTNTTDTEKVGGILNTLAAVKGAMAAPVNSSAVRRMNQTRQQILEIL